jgi:hypothetical protein
LRGAPTATFNDTIFLSGDSTRITQLRIDHTAHRAEVVPGSPFGDAAGYAIGLGIDSGSRYLYEHATGTEIRWYEMSGTGVPALKGVVKVPYMGIGSQLLFARP